MAAAALLSFAACNKTAPIISDVQEIPQTSRVIVSVDVAQGAMSKVAGATDADESAIDNVQVYVFRNREGQASANEIDGSRHFAAAEAGNSYSVDCTVGKRKVYIVVNASDGAADVREVANEQDLLDRVTLLGDNAPGRFLMIGSREISTTSTFETSVTVGRMVAAVVVDKVNVNFSSPALQESGVLVITDIYLSNVTGRNNYGNTTTWSALESAYWYNQLGTDAARSAAPEQVRTLTQETGLGIRLKHGECTPDGETHSFYCYPNDCSHHEGAPFTQRSTKLVFKTTLNGRTYYYPCDLSRANNNGESVFSLKANYKYHVTLNVNRPGAEDPDNPVILSTATFHIQVEDWITGQTYNFTI